MRAPASYFINHVVLDVFSSKTQGSVLQWQYDELRAYTLHAEKNAQIRFKYLGKLILPVPCCRCLRSWHSVNQWIVVLPNFTNSQWIPSRTISRHHPAWHQNMMSNELVLHTSCTFLLSVPFFSVHLHRLDTTTTATSKQTSQDLEVFELGRLSLSRHIALFTTRCHNRDSCGLFALHCWRLVVTTCCNFTFDRITTVDHVKRTDSRSGSWLQIDTSFR